VIFYNAVVCSNSGSVLSAVVILQELLLLLFAEVHIMLGLLYI